MNTSFRSSSRFASLAACAVLASSMSLAGCVADGTVETDESADFETGEEIAEGSNALTTTALANSIWLVGTWPFAANVNEKGRYVKGSVNGGNGKACWTHEKSYYSFGHVTGMGWTLFNGPGCGTNAKIAAIANTASAAGVNPCVEGASSLMTCTQPKVGSIVPLYSYPTQINASGQKVTSTAWSQVLSAKQANPTVPVQVIINPCNGPDVTKCGMTSAAVTDYNNEISKLVNAGIVVLGYIATNYATNDTNHPNIETEVKAAIDMYFTSYPGVRGVFFDEMCNGWEHFDYVNDELPYEPYMNDVNFYKRIRDYAKTKSSTMTAAREYTVVGNPGTDVFYTDLFYTLASITDMYLFAVDTLVIYENAGVASSAALQGVSAFGGALGWHSNWDRSNFAVLAYGVPTNDSSFLTTARPYAGYTYLTNDTLATNPWDSVSSYFSTMLGGLN